MLYLLALAWAPCLSRFLAHARDRRPPLLRRASLAAHRADESRAIGPMVHQSRTQPPDPRRRSSGRLVAGEEVDGVAVPHGMRCDPGCALFVLCFFVFFLKFSYRAIYASRVRLLVFSLYIVIHSMLVLGISAGIPPAI